MSVKYYDRIIASKKLPSGKQYYYARISYTDPLSGKICHKCLATGLETKNNKRRAEQVLMELLDTNAYLKQPPKQLNANVDPHIKLTCYLDR